MNTLTGKILQIETQSHLSLIMIEVDGILLKSIVIETPDTVPYLQIGKNVNALFKETEVVISKELQPNISMQNQIPCKIQNIETGKLLSRLSLNFNSHLITSVITSHAVENLNLKKGDNVVAMIKTNEMMLSEI